MQYAIVTQKGEVTLEETEVLELAKVQEVIGGDIEQMPSHPDVVVFAAAEPSDGYNWSATRLCQQYLMPTDRIFGTVVITGPADSDGDPTDISTDTVKTLVEWYEHRK